MHRIHSRQLSPAKSVPRPNRPPIYAALIVLGFLLTSSPLTRADSPSVTQASAEKPDLFLTGSVLQVNNDAVTSAEIINPMRDELAELARITDRNTFVAKTQPVIGRRTIDHIYNLLIYQEAKKELDKIDNIDQIIESYMVDKRNELLSNYGGSAAYAQGELARRGTTIDQQLEQIERTLIIDSYRQKYFAPSNEITRSQLLRYYRDHREEFVEKEMIQFQLIDIQVGKLLTQTDPNPEQLELAHEYAQQQAQQALQKLADGADFSNVTQQYSHGFRKNYGGLWRPVSPDALKGRYHPLLAELKKIAQGQNTGIVSGEDCFFIAKLLDHKQENTASFAQAQTDIAQILRQERWQKYTQKLGAELQIKATVGDVDKFIDETSRAAYENLRRNNTSQGPQPGAAVEPDN